MKWTTTKLMAVGSIGTLAALSQFFGATVASVTGLVGAEAFIDVFIIPIWLVLGMLTIPQFGTLTLISFVFSTLSLPIPAYGPPGFVPKIPANVLAGLIADIAFLLLRKRLSSKSASFVAAGPIDNALATAIYIMMIFLFPAIGLGKGFEFFLSPLPIIGLLIFGAVAGLIGGLVGWILYKKLENTAVVKRIQV